MAGNNNHFIIILSLYKSRIWGGVDWVVLALGPIHRHSQLQVDRASGAGQLGTSQAPVSPVLGLLHMAPMWGPLHISSEQAILRAEGLLPWQVKAAHVTLPGRKMQSCFTSYDLAPEVVQRHRCHMFLVHTSHQPNHIQEKGI